ncbi:MAG: RNA-binding S4 domain-containing protein [Chthonomonas sp.]|nr:RNA-binding S4 domain-containing protein [Chthonomonas sp.]
MNIEIRGENIQLQQLLKVAGVVSMGGEVKGLLAEGAILVNDVVATERRKKIVPGDTVRVGEVVITVA